MSPGRIETIFPSPEIRVVEASAGSGKTYALAKRYVQLILHLSRRPSPPPIHSILAITFTNKAAFEMKERILRFLKQLALGVMPESDVREILGPIGMDAAEAKGLAAGIMQVILRHYNYFQVETIDKFINSLLVSSAFQIGLTANFRIRTGAREHLARALDALIDESARNAALRHAFEDFLTSMLLVESRSSWMPKDVVLDTVLALFSEHNTYAHEFARGGLRPEDLLRAKTRAVTQVREFAARMPEGAYAQFIKSLSNFIERHPAGFRFNKELSKYFEPDKDVPLKKGCALTSAQGEAWDQVQRAFVEAAALEVGHLYDPYIELFERVHQRLQDDCRREDVVFLSQLNAIARRVYAAGLGADELYYRLAARFDHFLFDEFQDTSLLQWENLRVLPEEAVARGGSLFYVGDKKQAIYGFRGGDTRLFDAVAGQFADPGYHRRQDTLERSFRSHRCLVEFNNAVFSLENLERLMTAVDDKGRHIIPYRETDKAELERIYQSSRQIPVLTDPGGCVRVAGLQGHRKDEVLEDARVRVVERLRELRGRFAWQDIALLVRTNDDVEVVSRWLVEDGIPVSSERTLNIKEHPLIRELVAFLRFLASPVDNASFGEFILGDLFPSASGLSRDAVQELVLQWHCQKREPLYTLLRDRHPAAWGKVIDAFFANIGLYPLYELMVSFYRATGALDAFPDAQGFLMRFLEIIRSREDEYPSLDAFLDQYEALEGDELYVEVAGAGSAQALRVMTVHKAKGLEFRVVILPFLALGLKGSSSPGNKALAYTLREEDEGLRLYHFTSSHLPYSPRARDLDVEEDMSAFFSGLNTLYVALTRAACEMYVFLPPKVRQARNLALDLIPERLFSVGDPSGAYPVRKAEEEGAAVALAPSACRDWIGYLQEEFSAPEAWLNRHERRLGEDLHAILAHIGVVTPGGEADAVRAAVAQAGELEHASYCEKILLRALAEPGVRRFFTVPDAEVRCEAELVNRWGHVRRLDRLLITPQEITVVDFKTSAAGADEGVAQVREYMALLEEIHPGRRVSGILVFLTEARAMEVTP